MNNLIRHRLTLIAAVSGFIAGGLCLALFTGAIITVTAVAVIGATLTTIFVLAVKND